MTEITVTLDFLYIILSTCTFISLTVALISCIFAIKAYSDVNGLKNSTHNVTYMPIDPKVDRENEDYLKEKLQGEEWATSDEALAAQHKVFKEDMEESEFDFFLPDDEDKKIHSF